jgi:hypothetical protein
MEFSVERKDAANMNSIGVVKNINYCERNSELESSECRANCDQNGDRSTRFLASKL